jgi:hypothetical protein
MSLKGPARRPPRKSDVCGHHLAFYIEDVNAALAYLKARGIRPPSKPRRA